MKAKPEMWYVMRKKSISSHHYKNIKFENFGESHHCKNLKLENFDKFGNSSRWGAKISAYDQLLQS